MNFKQVTKRSFAFLMCVVMLMSCWVFTAPAASAANNENYSYTFKLETTNSGDCNDNEKPSITLYGRDTNGTGADDAIFEESVDPDYFQKKNTYEKSGSSDKFPSKIEIFIDFDGTFFVTRKWEGKITITVNGTQIMSKSFSLESDNSFQHCPKTLTITTDGIPNSVYPYAKTLSFVSKPANVTVPRAGETSITQPVSAEVRDQYGVLWYGAPVVVLSKSFKGISLSNGTLTVNSTANSEDGNDYQVNINATYLRLSENVSFTVTNATYQYEFLDENDNTISSGSLKYGKEVPFPATPAKESDNVNHYLFSGWTPAVGKLTADRTFKPNYTAQKHEFLKYISDNNATCTKDGTKTATCSCGYTNTLADTGSALGHSYNAVVTTQPGCNNPGVTTYTCIRGDHSYTQPIEALGHDYQSTVVAPTCTEQGYTLHVCTRCDDSYKTDITDALDHDWDEGVIQSNPTCTESGEMLYSCSRCEETRTETIDALGHNLVAWNVITRATCTQDGSKIGTCSRCLITATEVIPALGHSWGEWEEDTAPTCESSGRMIRYCSTCQTTDEKVIDALNHDMVLKQSDPDDGKQGMLYYECARNCGHLAACIVNEQGEATIGESCTQAELQEESAAIPTTTFNNYIRTESKYNYINRGASLRVDKTLAEDVQPIRFAASMVVPKDVELIDFGYIYIAADRFKSLKKFVIGGSYVKDFSVINGHYSTFETAEGDVKTFNIVIPVLKSDWSTQIIARPYIKYRYAGQEFTIYDHMYSQRSVDDVAQAVMNSTTESKFVKEYVSSKIINR